MGELCLLSPWSPGDAGKRVTFPGTGWGCGTRDLPARWWDSVAPGQCRVGRWQIKDSEEEEEEEEGAELAPQDQEVSWTR